MISFNEQQKTTIRNLAPLTDSKFKYKSDKWLDLNRNYKELLKIYENREISRQDVINAYSNYFTDSNNSYMKPFLLTMIWGFADTGYGTHRTNNYISTDENKEKIKKALNFINENNLDSLNNAFKQLNKIKGLGISYMTKILYFATRAKGITNYALIFDIRVASALVKLTTPKEIYGIVNVGPSSKFKDYEKFNNIIHGIAEQNNVEAEQLEMYLFNQEF
jgi:hypothetical protein